MSTIKHRVTVLLVAAALPAAVLFTPSDGDASPLLGSTAETFAVLAGSGVANAGATTIVGNVGSAPTNSISGFMPPAIITDGAIASTAAAQQAQIEASAAYNAVLGLTPTQSLTGQNLGGLTLVPGVYDFSSSAALTGSLVLNAEGLNNAAFIFQIGSTLTTAADSMISVINGGLGDSIFWQVGSSATLGASSLFLGNILADTSITLDPFAQIACGRALAGIVTASGTVTMANANGVSISNGASCVSGYDSVSSSPAMVPEPGTLALLFAGLAGITAIRMRLGSPSPAPMQEKIDGV